MVLSLFKHDTCDDRGDNSASAVSLGRDLVFDIAMLVMFELAWSDLTLKYLRSPSIEAFQNP